LLNDIVPVPFSPVRNRVKSSQTQQIQPRKPHLTRHCDGRVMASQVTLGADRAHICRSEALTAVMAIAAE
jgi:hypothetical protein